MYRTVVALAFASELEKIAMSSGPSGDRSVSGRDVLTGTGLAGRQLGKEKTSSGTAVAGAAALASQLKALGLVNAAGYAIGRALPVSSRKAAKNMQWKRGKRRWNKGGRDVAGGLIVPGYPGYRSGRHVAGKKYIAESNKARRDQTVKNVKHLALGSAGAGVTAEVLRRSMKDKQKTAAQSSTRRDVATGLGVVGGGLAGRQLGKEIAEERVRAKSPKLVKKMDKRIHKGIRAKLPFEDHDKYVDRMRKKKVQNIIGAGPDMARLRQAVRTSGRVGKIVGTGAGALTAGAAARMLTGD